MLDSLVRVSRRVLKVPKAKASPTGVQRSLSEDTAASSRTGPVESRHESPDAHRISASTSDGPDANFRIAAPRHCDTVGRAGRETGVRTETARRRHSVSTPILRPAPNGSRRPTRGEVHEFVTPQIRARTERSADREVRDRLKRPTLQGGRDTLNLPIRPFGFLRFTPERFHVLLNSLFKVLFNFPSRYLFAIGLVVIFSLRWSLPPT